jgi:putative DNA primase/helicase
VSSERRPIALEVNVDNIPLEIRNAGRRFVTWRYVHVVRRGWSKVPFNARTGGKASTTDETSWSLFDEAVAAYVQGGYDGIGFVFNGDGLVGTDIDKVRDPTSGVLTDDRALDIIETLGSYTEVSVSGTGVHVIARGHLPTGGNRRDAVEMYSTGRYFTLTGHQIGQTATVEECNGAIAAVHRRYIAEATVMDESTPPSDETPTEPEEFGKSALVSDDDLLDSMRRFKHGDEFSTLFDRGDTGPYASESEADQALANRLLWLCNGDIERAERLFDRSALGQREKWRERADYRSGTLENARDALLRSGETGYSPASEPTDIDFPTRSIDAILNDPPLVPLIGEWISQGAFTAVWGLEYSGKSLYVLDITLSLAVGVPFMGIELSATPVLYVLAEGRLRERIRAWQSGHQDADFDMLRRNFRSHAKGFSFADPKQTEGLLNYVEQKRPAVVAFDTLAVTIEGDENSGKDMGKVISTCLEIQRISSRQTAPLLVCHPGKDASKGIRGHSSLAPALESSIHVTGIPSKYDARELAVGSPTGGTVAMHSKKNKEGAKLATVTADIVGGGESVYLRLRQETSGRNVSDGARRMLHELAEAGTIARSQWGRTTGLTERRLRDLRKDLVERGYVEESVEYGTVTLTESGHVVL